jgi:hypothetical protein
MYLVFPTVMLLLLVSSVSAAEIGLNATTTSNDIIMSGQIMSGDSIQVNKLIHKLVEDNKARRFIIHSPGGSVSEAMDIGRLLRSYGFSVLEPAQVSCISACVLAVAGGNPRILMGKIGLHHPYFPNILVNNPVAIKVQAEGKESIAAYMEAMGVKKGIVDAMYAIKDPAEIRYLDAHQLTAYNISTGN